MSTARRWRLRHPGLPIEEVGSEIVNGEGSCLFVAPRIGHRPEQVGVGGDFLGEGSPLGVAHDAASATFFDAGEFTTRDQRGRRGSGITSAHGHEIGEVQASGGHSDRRLSRLQGGFRHVLNRECVRAVQSLDD